MFGRIGIREIADNITETVKRIVREHNLTTSSIGIPLDTRAEILLGYNVDCFFNRTENLILNASCYGSELRTEIATNEILTDYENYSDLLCYASLVEWRKALSFAKKNALDLILIDSWNEFNERSMVEPHWDATACTNDPYFLYNKTKQYTYELRGISSEQTNQVWDPLVLGVISIGVAFGIYLFMKFR